MSKEINLFENETLFSSQPSQYFQPMLPGMTAKLQEKHAKEHIKRVLEALFFASSEPISFDKLREITDEILQLKPRALREIILELKHEYVAQQRSFRLEEIAQGFVMRTCEEYKKYIEMLGRTKRGEKLSQAGAEVLAIIAYKQPVTRPQIDSIRGVDSSGIIQTLLERELVAPAGKLEAPGRPTLYETTKGFLQHFGLNDLSELPPIEGFQESLMQV